MKETRLLMGMPITIEIVDAAAGDNDRQEVFAYFQEIDRRFSPYKVDSEISRLNDGRLKPKDYSADLRLILKLSAETKKDSQGFFDIYQAGRCDPSGLVKGWAILQAALRLQKKGFKNYYVNAGGDIQAAGTNSAHEIWRVGICNPFKEEEIVKVIGLNNGGVATSGTYRRGQHIYNPFAPDKPLQEIVSLSVIGPDVYEADRFATAAFAMGRPGLDFIEGRPDLEAYMIDKNGQATFTSGFNKYLI